MLQEKDDEDGEGESNQNFIVPHTTEKGASINPSPCSQLYILLTFTSTVSRGTSRLPTTEPTTAAFNIHVFSIH